MNSTLDEQIEAQRYAVEMAPRELRLALEDVLGRLVRLQRNVEKLEGMGI